MERIFPKKIQKVAKCYTDAGWMLPCSAFRRVSFFNLPVPMRKEKN